MKKNLHIIYTDYVTQSRLRKTVKTLLENNYFDLIQIECIRYSGLHDEGVPENEKIFLSFNPQKISISFLETLSKILNYFIFQYRVYFRHRDIEYDAVNCHSLLLLPVGYFLKMNGNVKRLIYDAHELETERIGLSTIQKYLLKIIEKILVRKVDKMIVVSKPIQYWYNFRYKSLPVYTIRNFPSSLFLVSKEIVNIKKALSIVETDILFVYQGILSRARGIDFLLQVFSSCNPNKHILFLGYGEAVARIKEAKKNHNNIHFHDAVDYSVLCSYTAAADIGIHFINKDEGLSYRFSLPNKFGEYIMSGIPILISNNYFHLTELVEKNNLGWSVGTDQLNLINFVNNLQFDLIHEKKLNVQKYAHSISWEQEAKHFRNVYS